MSTDVSPYPRVSTAMPRPPTNLRVSDVTSESVRLTWSYDLDQDTIQYYVIQYNQKHSMKHVSGVGGGLRVS